MEFKYKPLWATKTKSRFSLKRDFKPVKSNKIITDLVKKIEQYEQSRGMEIKYDRVMTDLGERIAAVKMKSIDDFIQGEINYEDPQLTQRVDGIGYTIAYIDVKFKFKAKDESLKQDYQAIAKYLREMGFKTVEDYKIPKFSYDDE